MTTEELIIALFCEVDASLGLCPQATLWPSALVTVGLLFALKDGHFRAFYRWLKQDYAALFGSLPERTRLQRFLADPTCFTVIDSYGIELVPPLREGRSPQQIGKTGKSTWRWIVGMKLCGLINDRGKVVD